MDEIRRACRLAETKKDAWWTARWPRRWELSTPYPGGHVLDHRGPEFAAMVAEAGGCPPSPYGLMDAAALDQSWEAAGDHGGRPYAVNVVSLQKPYRQAQLAG